MNSPFRGKHNGSYQFSPVILSVGELYCINYGNFSVLSLFWSRLVASSDTIQQENVAYNQPLSILRRYARTGQIKAAAFLRLLLGVFGINFKSVSNFTDTLNCKFVSGNSAIQFFSDIPDMITNGFTLVA